MEDYKEKYEQALERAKVINPGTADYEVAVKIFPELKENEDKISNEIIDYLKGYIPHHDDNLVAKSKLWIAWLENYEDKLEKAYKCADEVQYRRGYEAAKREFEKQDSVSLTENELEALRIAAYESVKNWSEKLLKLCRTQIEQKPDKVEPKFKVNDWITDGTSTFQIVEIRDEWYIVDDGDRVRFDIIDQYYHLWTIQDAEDGDVLSSENPFIFRGFGDKRNPNSPTAYCGIDLSGNFILSTENDWWTNRDVHPATKEQRDLLFSKMKEVGYEWDVEKKELKKIEKPAEWSEEDEKTLNTIIEKGDLKPSEIGWLKSLKERVRPKQEWSEEDERIHQCLIKDQEKSLNEVKNDKYGHSEIISDLKEMYRKRIDWLKSLKQRNL